MTEITTEENQIINEFFESFSESTLSVFSDNMDAEISLEITSLESITDIASLIENNAIYKLNYYEGYKGDFLTLIPEEFIATISDIIMGGKGENVYKGNLTELEINASSRVLQGIFDKAKILYKTTYTEELSYTAEPEFLIKDTPKYTAELENKSVDLAINYTLTLNKDKEFKIHLLLNSDEIKKTLIYIGLLIPKAEPLPQEPEKPKMPEISFSETKKVSPYDISKIADIKIDISAELGRAKMSIKQVLGLTKGSIIELDTYDNSDIKIFANGMEVAKAQVVVIDENFGIKITKIITPQERSKHL